MSHDWTPGHGGRLEGQLAAQAGAQPVGPRLKALPSAPSRFRALPGILRALKTTVLLAILQTALVAGLWWLSEEWLTPRMPTSIERVADLYAAAAGRFMVATDQRAVDLLVKQGATWPMLAYVGVEDAHGTVLAHTDPARVGRIGNEATTSGLASTPAGPLREITVLVQNPGQKIGPPVGRVRLGYRALDEGTIVPSTLAEGSVVFFLVATVVATIPLAWLVIGLAKPSGRRPGEAPGSPLETLAQVAWANQGQAATEVRHLKVVLAEREGQIARLTEAMEHRARSISTDPSHQRAILSITQAVRTSLSNILGFSKLLLRDLDGRLTETQTADVLNIQRAGAELLSFVTALSELNRVEAGQILIRPEAMDAQTLLNELAAEYGSAHSLDIKVECPAGLPMVRTDRGHLGQILHTLIMQATLPSGNHGEVVLRARPNGEMIDISVAHPGRIVSDDDLATMFDPHRSREPNTGRIGLTLARSLAVLNAASLAVESQPSTGVVFTLTVPTEPAHAG